MIYDLLRMAKTTAAGFDAPSDIECFSFAYINEKNPALRKTSLVFMNFKACD